MHKVKQYYFDIWLNTKVYLTNLIYFHKITYYIQFYFYSYYIEKNLWKLYAKR